MKKQSVEQRLNTILQEKLDMIRQALLSLLFISFYDAAITQAVPPSFIRQDDSVIVAASAKYADPSIFKKLFLGKNYRKEWSTPVTLPVFDLKGQGFTITELGGGQQTKSLRLKDKSGHEWALRSIDKDVEGALPSWLRNTLAEKVTQDMVSAAHPYAPLIVYHLAEKAGIVAAQPHFYFVPDDADFGDTRKFFANTVVMLEDREPTPDRTETENTENVVEELLEKNTTLINGEAVLRARLLDMLVGDWDRHQDQWRWGATKKDRFTYFYAIPRDRDQALFFSNGLLVKTVRLFALKHMVGFSKNTSKLRKLNTKSWNFDRTFLNQLNAQDWSRITRKFQSDITSEVIKQAVLKLPASIYEISGKELEEKLINRKNSLYEDVMDYYRFISSYVTITGTDAAEQFMISGNKDSITVAMYAMGNLKTPLYKRTFLPAETYQINLIALGGDDKVVVDKTAAARIRLRIDGGKGKNEYAVNSKIKHKIINSDMDAALYEKTLKEMLKIKE